MMLGLPSSQLVLMVMASSFLALNCLDRGLRANLQRADVRLAKNVASP